MLHKCANPECPRLFRKMSEGRLFQFHRTLAKLPGNDKLVSARPFEYFWLCDRCRSILTLVFDPATGIRVVPAGVRNAGEKVSPALNQRRNENVRGLGWSA